MSNEFKVHFQINFVSFTIRGSSQTDCATSLGFSTKLADKVLIIRPNTTYRSSTIVFYYTLQHVSAVQFSHHQTDVGPDIHLMMADLDSRIMSQCIIKDYCTRSICCVWSGN